jgi:hypothetical protein
MSGRGMSRKNAPLPWEWIVLALQHGVALETIRAALTRDHDGGPATLLGAALDALAGRGNGGAP